MNRTNSHHRYTWSRRADFGAGAAISFFACYFLADWLLR